MKRGGSWREERKRQTDKKHMVSVTQIFKESAGSGKRKRQRFFG